jgi:hypothetical protein
MRGVLVGGWCAVLAMGCGEAGGDTDPSGADPEDTASNLPAPAPMATPSGGCPAFDATGEFTITSNGKERRGEIYWPRNPEPGMSVLFTWHGLSSGIDIVNYFVTGFDLDELARQRNAVIVVPEALSTNLVGQSVQLWGILGNEEDDLVLYDDLRACVAEKFDIDARKVSSWGFSGGALWTSFLVMHRADTLATAAALSGGTDLEIPLLGDRLAYTTPAWDIPVMLSSGGSGDVWPDPTFTIIDFEASSDSFQTQLVADGSFVTRCRHSTGHNVPENIWTAAKKFLFDHTYGAPSPYASGEAELADACEVVTE